MSFYETPDLLEVGAIENVVFGTSLDKTRRDNPTGDPTSPQALSVLDFD
jgi:hypothetical protein